MPMTGDRARLQRVAHGFALLATPSSAPRVDMLEEVKRQGLLRLKVEFTDSVSASGDPFAKTARGKPALLSKKLPYAFGARVDRDSVRFVGRVGRDWLDVLRTGHTFPERKVAAGKQYLSFSGRGRLVSESRLFNKKGELRKGAHQIFSREHRVRQRVLPPRPPLPDGNTLPPPWEAVVKAGLSVGFGRFIERLSR